MNKTELPVDFTHEPPKNYTYEVVQFKRNIFAIWCCNHSKFTYNDGAVAKSIWGFYNTKTGNFHAPINPKSVGNVVDIESTTPYSAMQLNFSNPLEYALYT